MKKINAVGQNDELPNKLFVVEETMPSTMQMNADKTSRKLKKFPITMRLRKFVTAPFCDLLSGIV